MRKTGSVNHTHQYFRRDDGLWACSGIDNCSHYMPKNMSPAPVGRMSRCWSCKKEFQLDPINMQNDKPICDACTEEINEENRYIEERLSTIKPLDRFSSSDPLTALRNRAKKNQEEADRLKQKQEIPDQIEVIQPDEEHAPDCGVYEDGECTCMK